LAKFIFLGGKCGEFWRNSQKKKVPLTMLLLRTFSLTKWRICQRIFATKKSLRLVSDHKPWFEATQPTLQRKEEKESNTNLLLCSQATNKQM
jgi:hypothetical protein